MARRQAAAERPKLLELLTMLLLGGFVHVAASGEEPGGEQQAEVVFGDEDGDTNQVTLAGGRMRWCISGSPGAAPEGGAGCRCRVVRELRLSLLSDCRLKVTFLEPLGGTWSAVVAQPSLPAGARPREVAEQLLRLAHLERVRVGGAMVQVKGRTVALIGEGCLEPPGHVTEFRPPLRFTLPLAVGNASPLRIEIPGQWQEGNAPGLCVALVERPEDCARAFQSGRACTATPLWHLSDHEKFLAFEVPLPSFPLLAKGGALASHHSVCLRGVGPLPPYLPDAKPGLVLLGQVEYYRLPQVRFLLKEVRVGVRTFLNPGWRERIVLECWNCTAQSSIAIQPIQLGHLCRGLAQQSLAALAAAVRDGQVPANVDMLHHKNSMVDEIVSSGGAAASLEAVKGCEAPIPGPCLRWDEGFRDVAIVGLSDDGPLGAGEASFTVESSRRLLTKERQLLFHRRSALCFYPDEKVSSGWLVGFVAVHMDSPDLQAFIGFVCFFGVALPLICLVSSLLHYNKNERCKQHVHILRLAYQRSQLDREIGARGRVRQGRAGAAGSSAGWAAGAGGVPTATGATPETWQFVSLLSGPHFI